MKKISCLVTVLVWLGLILAACGQIAPAPKVVPKADWEGKWESTLQEAKKEGVVNIYGNWAPKTREELTSAFKEKYGIGLEMSSFQGPQDIIPKVLAEKAADRIMVDVIGTGSIILAKPQGILGAIRPLLMLPEVMDPNAWVGGELPFSDRDGTELAMMGLLARPLAYNSELVREGEITDYRDLLKPQYKGKILIHDPSVPGPGAFIITHLGTNVWGEAPTTDFLTRLIKEQGAVVARDYRGNIEALSRGKYAVLVGPDTALLAEFVSLGATVKPALLKEDNLLTSAAGSVAVSVKPPHPNATAIFVNWLLGKEGQSIFARTSNSPSRRLDASSEGIYAPFIPERGKKYYNANSEEFTGARVKWLEISKKIIAESSK